MEESDGVNRVAREPEMRDECASPDVGYRELSEKLE
jgi:hypothetical protein